MTDRYLRSFASISGLISWLGFAAEKLSLMVILAGADLERERLRKKAHGNKSYGPLILNFRVPNQDVMVCDVG